MAVFTTRPVIMGTRGVVTSGHYLATAAGFRITAGAWSPAWRPWS